MILNTQETKIYTRDFIALIKSSDKYYGAFNIDISAICSFKSSYCFSSQWFILKMDKKQHFQPDNNKRIYKKATSERPLLLKLFKILINFFFLFQILL